MDAIVLFGSGSPIIVDVEESCARLGRAIAAVVKNVQGQDWSSDPALLVPLAAAPAELWRRPMAVPLFRPENRHAASSQARLLGAGDFPALVDPTTIIPRRVDIAEGVYINAGCVVGAAARFGAFTFVNRGCSLGHHIEVGPFASIGPGAVVAGQVTIGRGALLGAGVVIGPGLSIGAHARIGPGAVVTADVPDHGCVVAPPGRSARAPAAAGW